MLIVLCKLFIVWLPALPLSQRLPLSDLQTFSPSVLRKPPSPDSISGHLSQCFAPCFAPQSASPAFGPSDLQTFGPSEAPIAWQHIRASQSEFHHTQHRLFYLLRYGQGFHGVHHRDVVVQIVGVAHLDSVAGQGLHLRQLCGNSRNRLLAKLGQFFQRVRLGGGYLMIGQQAF